MKLTTTTTLNDKQLGELNELWNNEYPEKLQHKKITDFEEYLNNLPGKQHVLLTDDQGVIKGWYVSFGREDEKWFAMILDSSIHGQGYGTQILNQVKEAETEIMGWVIDHNRDIKRDGQAYKSPLQFYTKNGFVVLPDVRLELTKISAVKIVWHARKF